MSFKEKLQASKWFYWLMHACKHAASDALTGCDLHEKQRGLKEH